MNELNMCKEPKGKIAPDTKRDVLLATCVALGATFLFYANALVSGSLNAGFLYTGDAWNVCVPLIAKVNSLVQHGAFAGIDFSTHGGASELGLRPNLYPYHPLLLLYSFFAHSDAPQRLMRVSVVLLALHSFVGCYFAFRLSSRYFKLGAGAAAFVAVGYTFSFQMVYSLFYPPYIFSAALFPWAIYSGLAVSDHPSIRRIVGYSLPSFIMFVGGYVPLAMSAVALAWAFLAVYLLYIDASYRLFQERVRHLVRATMPFILSGVVVAPLYYAISRYFTHVHASTAVSVFFSAYQLAEQPRSILRLFSSRLYVSGPLYELTEVWGLVPVIITVIFFAGFRDLKELSISDWRLFKIVASVYALIILSIYGNYSPVSDLLYFVPAIGSMHIYQRHLLVGQFFFIVAIAVMFDAIVRRGSLRPAKVTLFSLALLLVVCAHLVSANSPTGNDLHLNDYIVFDLLLGVLFAASLMVHEKWFAFIVGSFFVFLGPLDLIYDYSTRTESRIEVQRAKEVVLDAENNQRILSYFRSHSHKAIIKYVDLLPGPGITSYFSRNYPWFVALDLPLSTYGGYDFLLAMRDSYGRRMPYIPNNQMWQMRPDWAWVSRTGGEFVVYREGFDGNDPHLGDVVDLRDPRKVLRLPQNIVIAPLRADIRIGFPAGIVKGRYVRVQLAGTNYLSLAEVRVFGDVGNGGTNLARGKATSQSSTAYADAGASSSAIDGNTNGDFGQGSVTHTKQDPNAWWQVDLGASVRIKDVEIWNRTDGGGERLSDYWVFVSDSPFQPGDRPGNLRQRAGTIGAHLTTRPSPSVRIPASGGSEKAPENILFDNGYLRMVGERNGAVVTGFSTDGAARLTLDLKASRPVKVHYLFWPNERLKFYLRGHRVDVTTEDGLQTVSLAAGDQHLEIHYEYWPLRLFLILYFLYAVGVIATVVVPWVLRAKTTLQRRRRA